MSTILFKEDIRFLQRILVGSNFYSGPANGIWSSLLDEAETMFMADAEACKRTYGELDARSEKNIITLHPAAQGAARHMIMVLQDLDFDARVISGTRSYAEQNTLYRLGRFGSDAEKVTNARGGQSNHNFGIAWDIGLFGNGKYLTSDRAYKAAAAAVLSAEHLDDVEWGGDWVSFPDFPHYQLHTGLSVTETRACFESLKPYVVTTATVTA